MAAQTRPARVVIVDVSESLPDLRADEHYRDAWVVFCRDGVPRCMVTLDLTSDATAIESRLRDLVGQTEASSNGVEDTALNDAELPRISVIVPTIVTRVEELGYCLDAIEKLDYPNFEVVLVDNRRELPALDPLPSLVSGRARVRVVRESRPGISAARNAGAANANGDVIAFTDDDVRVDQRWLRAIGERMARSPRVDVVTGLILPTELETPAQIWFERYFGGFGSERSFAPVTLEAAPSGRLLRGSRVLVREASGNEMSRFSVYGIGAYGAGANMAFRRTALERIGGFDCLLGVGTPAHGGEDLVAMIDVLWTGGLVAYEPAAFVHHRHRQEYGALLRQLDGYALGFTAMLVSLIRRDPRHLVSIASQLPGALKRKGTQGLQRVRGRASGAHDDRASKPRFPSALFRRELWALSRGPLAYARSQRSWRSINTHRGHH